MAAEPLAIGCAAGFGGDRTDAAGPVVDTLVSRGCRGVLIFEVLAERTLALAQLDRRANPDRGYAPLTEPMVRPILRRCLHHGISIVSNFGAANPAAAASLVRRIAREEGAPAVRVAVVEGDDLSGDCGRELLRGRLAPADAGRELVSASAYLGAAAIADALRAGAQVVITGRVADPSLAVGPAMAHFGWAETDWDKLGRATIAGHLIECGAQVTGVLPVLAEVAGPHGVPPVQVAQAALLGQMTTGFPVSPLTPATYLIVGLARVDLADHQRFSFAYLFGASVLMTLAGVAFGVIPV